MDTSCSWPVPIISNPTSPIFQSVLLTSNVLLSDENSTPLESMALIVSSLVPGTGLHPSALRLIIPDDSPCPSNPEIESSILPRSSDRITV